MLKSELVTKLAAELTHLPVNKIEAAVNLILITMKEQLVNGGRAEIRGFGCFTVRYHKPRKARNPKTGEKLFTEGKNSAHFKASKVLNSLLNK
ncbi:MAG: hypothetical protein A3F18_00350 [Legionellales bacterium RIFCSPHIGHO2_12_FULL_37_14]|nr:MAG: hypothetical protein A3F18_00350 [Legionellales bacterium RIFCSPHIGHO2_12_FULL_37_14]